MKKENLLNLSLLILRIIVGSIFIVHGAQKLFGMFNGIGIDGTAKMIESLGMYSPYVLAIIWAAIEFIGGIFLILGALARWAAIAIVCAVLVLWWKTSLVYGFFVQDGSVEYNFLITGACIPIILLGGGSWSVWDI